MMRIANGRSTQTAMKPASDVPAPDRLVSRPSPAVVLLLSSALCAIGLWPALLNGFPLLFDDSKTYLQGTHSSPWWPIFYPLFVALGRHVGSPWVPIIAQAALTAYILPRSVSLLAGVANQWICFFAAASVLAVSQLPWLNSYILTDLFGGLSILCVIVLAFKWERMDPFDRILFVGTALFGAVAATANAFVLLPVGAGVLVSDRPTWRSSRSLRLTAVAFALVTICLPVATNAVRFGSPTYAVGSSARLFSKLVDNGIAVPFLRTHCGSEHYHACDQVELISKTAGGEGFLWQGPAYANDRQAWFDRDADYGRLVRRIVWSHPSEVARFAARDVFILARRVTYGPKELASYADGSMPKLIAKMYSPYEAAFMAARQQQGSISQIFPRQLYSASVVISFALALFCWWRFKRSAQHTAAAVTLWLIAAFLWCLIVHGALSSPTPRYNVKASWLLWIPAAVFLIRAVVFRKTREQPLESAPD